MTSPRGEMRWSSLPAGKADAFLGFPAGAAGAARSGILAVSFFNTGTERPWSQYFCCTLFACKQELRQQTTRSRRNAIVRAIMKATDYCAAEPTRCLSQLLIERGFAERLD